MTKSLPEIKEMMEAGKRFLVNECSIIELNGYVNRVVKVARGYNVHPAVLQLAQEWSAMVNRYWNEWGHESHPLTREEFCRWLQQQIGL